jgi:hypothetical protein
MYSGVFSSLFINNYFSQFNGTNGTFLNVHRISRYPRLVYAPYTTVRPPPISNDLWSMMYASQFLDAIETRMNQSQRCRWDVQNSHQSTVCISSFDSNFFDPGFDFRFYNFVNNWIVDFPLRCSLQSSLRSHPPVVREPRTRVVDQSHAHECEKNATWDVTCVPVFVSRR